MFKIKQRKPNFFEAILPLIVMILLLGVGYGVMKLRAEPLLIAAALFAGIVALWLGFSWDEMLEGIVEKMTKSMPATMILITVGIIVGSWIFSGTIPMMIYYGLKIISPKYILVTSFVLTALVSSATGTSWGSVSTIGVALIGIAAGQGVSLPAAAGAIISGAYFGDKMSPLSDTTNLAPIAAGSELYEHIKHMLWTTLPVFLISIIVYLIVGMNSGIDSGVTPIKVSVLLTTLNTIFRWNLLLMIPPAIVLLGSIYKKPTIPVMIFSSITALILGMSLQGIDRGFSLKNGFTSLVSGFNVNMLTIEGFDVKMVSADVIRLINRGGMNSMIGTLLIAFCAFGFAGIISKTGCLDVVLNKLLSVVRTTGALIASTVLSCLTMALVTGSSYLSILIPGELFSNEYAKRGLAAKNLSRTLEDAGTVVAPLVPWSMAGVFMAETLGVKTIDYIPWAFLCYGGFIFALIYGFTGIGIAKKK